MSVVKDEHKGLLNKSSSENIYMSSH